MGFFEKKNIKLYLYIYFYILYLIIFIYLNYFLLYKYLINLKYRNKLII